MKPEALTNAQILEVRDDSQHLSPLDKASRVLAKATGAALDAVEQLTLGQRAALSLSLRRMMFGPTLDLVHRCPNCDEPIAVEIAVADIEAVGANARDQGSWPFAIGEWRGRFRLPDATDLRAAEVMQGMAPARDALLRRCVIEAHEDTIVVDPAALPEEVAAALGEQILLADPLALVMVDLTCAECAWAGAVALDIDDILQREIDEVARALLADVDRLARRYGWREADILAMSPARRRAYLSLED